MEKGRESERAIAVAVAGAAAAGASANGEWRGWRPARKRAVDRRKRGEENVLQIIVIMHKCNYAANLGQAVMFVPLNIIFRTDETVSGKPLI